MTLTNEQLEKMIKQELDKRLNRESILNYVNEATGIRDGALAYSLLEMAKRGHIYPLIDILVEAGRIEKMGDLFSFNM